MNEKKDMKMLVLAPLLVVAAFLVFGRFINPQFAQNFPYSVEIAAAFLGTLLTVSVTALLLRHETAYKTNAELDKEKNVKIYDERIKTYTELMEKIEEILLRETVDDKDSIQLQFLFHKMAFVAGKPVLESMGNFAEFFSKAAEDGSIVEDREKILKEFGKLTVKMRADLVAGENENESEISKIMDKNIQFRPWSPEEREFLLSCEPDERDYYSQTIKSLKSAGISYKKESVGISVKDKQGRSIVHLYPKGSRNKSQFVPSKPADENPNHVQEVLSTRSVTSPIFNPSTLPVESLIALIREMT